MQDAAARDNYLHGSIDMVWELSLYGESANRQQAGEAVVLSAQAREQGVRISVVANVVQNYLRLYMLADSCLYCPLRRLLRNVYIH